jgi:hypothetical protein
MVSDRNTIGYFPAKAQRRQGYGKKREMFANHSIIEIGTSRLCALAGDTPKFSCGSAALGSSW